MSIFVAILGLALLIFIHEVGHFGAALAVGMRPRGFSIGFGPPLAKIRRNDIDYAFRAVPLGGYVTIPGMTRPQESDVDAFFGGAIRDAPELVGPSERLKRALAASDFEQARVELDAFETAAGEGGGNGTTARREARRRQPLRGRVLAAADLEADRHHRRGPRHEPRLRGRDLRRRAHVRGWEADDGGGRRPRGPPGAGGRPAAGRQDPRDRRRAGHAVADHRAHLRLGGRPAPAPRPPQRRAGAAGAGSSEARPGRRRLSPGLPAGRGAARARRVVAGGGGAHGAADGRDRAGRSRTSSTRKGASRSRARSASSTSRRRPPAGDGSPTLRCSRSSASRSAC